MRKSPNIPGVEYEMNATEHKDECNRCGGTGKLYFSTAKDMRAYHTALEAHTCDCPCCDGDCGPKPWKSGIIRCGRCQGTGKRDGDGYISFKLTAPQITMAPASGSFDCSGLLRMKARAEDAIFGK